MLDLPVIDEHVFHETEKRLVDSAATLVYPGVDCNICGFCLKYADGCSCPVPAGYFAC